MTTTTTDEIFAQAMTLDNLERQKLVERIQAESAIDSSMDEAWVEKMQGRLDRLRNGEARRIPGAEVKRRIAEHLASTQ